MIIFETDNGRAVTFEDCPELQFAQTLLTEEQERTGKLDPLLAHVPVEHEHLLAPTVTSILRRSLGCVCMSASEAVRQDKTVFCGSEAGRILMLFENAAKDVDMDGEGVTKKHPQFAVAEVIWGNKTTVTVPSSSKQSFEEPDRFPTLPLPPAEDYLDHRLEDNWTHYAPAPRSEEVQQHAAA